MDEVKEPEVNHVQFNEESNRQKVSLFPTGQAALVRLKIFDLIIPPIFRIPYCRYNTPVIVF
jgi:hypothetical protein